MALVRAKQAGFVGQYREPGDVFEFEGELAPWMELANEEGPEKKPAEKAKAKAQAKSTADQDVI